MRTLALSVLLLGVPALAGAAPRHDDPAADKKAASPDALVAKMQSFYESTRDLQARFDQVLATGTGRKRTASGEMWLKKPGRMRWEYKKPEPKLMVADGKELWVYVPEDEQAFKQDLKSSSLPSSVSFLWGEGKLRDEFDISVDDGAKVGDVALDGEGQVVLKLVPKKPTAQYRYLDFVVDEKSGQVVRTVIWDQQGGTNLMTFHDVKTNTGIGDERFRFTPPVGTHVIRP